MSAPPRLARRLLERRLHGPTRDYLLGDLEERFHAMRRRSALRAHLWYWRQAMVALVLPVPGPADVAPSGAVRTLGADVRRAARALARRPAHLVSTVVPLAIGIGAVSTAFSIVWGTVLAGLPFDEADRLVHFERARLAAGETWLAVTPHDYLAWREAQQAFVDLGAYVEREIAFAVEGAPPDRHTGVAISANSFDLLRVEAALGRSFTEAETVPGAPPVILLSHRLWRGRFGADPSIVGRDVVADGRPHTVVGVMPEGFGFPIAEAFWLPLRLDLSTLERGRGRLDVFGRLRNGATLEAARAEFDGITEGLAAAWPDTNAGISALLRSFADEYVGDDFIRTVFRILLGATLVLVVCCANVANLLLIRGFHRRRDLAVRRALGATRGSIVRQLVAESLLVSAAAALLGVALAFLGVEWFNRVGTGVGVFDLPHGSDSLFWWDVGLSPETLAVTVGVTAATALLAGLAPSLTVAKASSLTRRGSGGEGKGRMQRGILVGQLALTAGLLVAAVSVARSALNVAGTTERLVDEDVTVLRLSLPSATGRAGAYASLDGQRRLLEELARRLASDPAVRAATVATSVPLDAPWPVPFHLEDQPVGPADAREVGVVTVDAGYFDVFDVEPLEGRRFDDSDRAGSAPVALVNRSFAERWLPGRSPVGTRLRLGDADAADTDAAAEPWVEVVGVLPDLWERPGDPGGEAGVYLPLSQVGVGQASLRVGRWGLAYPTLAVRAARRDAVDAALLGRHVYALDRTLPLRSVETMTSLAERRLGRYHVWGRFWMAFAATALLLAGLGIYGVFSFRVTRRTSEIGVRRALGASEGSVQRAVLRGALADVVVGALAGLWLGAVLTGGLEQLLYDVDARDPRVYGAAGAIVVAVGLFASWWPARRAARIDPRDAIRAE